METLIIDNFKCFQNIEIPLNRLTVFAGGNGNGKSTAIQSLLFLRSTIEQCTKLDGKQYKSQKINGTKVDLNGSFCLALGDSSNIINRVSEEVWTTLGISCNSVDFNILYEIEPSKLWLEPTDMKSSSVQNESAVFKHEFYYLNAERIGPRISQSIQFYDYPTTGFQGEFVAQLIGDTEFSYKFKVPEKRRFEGLKTPRLEQQINAWLDFLMPGVAISASYDTNSGSAQLRVKNRLTRGASVIAPNIGFGISYVLPILVTGLIAEEGSFLVVENPEAHLHPSAQSRIGRFLSIVANSGVKVIIETHSDHVINGIQVAAASSKIAPDLVTMNFFSQNKALQQPEVVTIEVGQLGELSKWPKGFFDQGQIDYRALLKLRRNE